MTNVLAIKVTEEDIKKGSVGDATSCPIALALNRRFSTADGSTWAHAFVPGDRSRLVVVHVYHPSYDEVLQFRHRDKSIAFVQRIDKREVVEPQTVYLTWVD